MQTTLFGTKSLLQQAQDLAKEIAALPLKERVEALNAVRAVLHEISPFKDEPVDFVAWVPAEDVQANDYNPNKVAKQEMLLLRDSIQADGFTQPIVTFPEEDLRHVVDGAHRKLVGSEGEIRERLHGYLPVTVIDKSLEERMFSTVRHNRARGKHAVDLMADLVKALIQQGCTDVQIAEHLGMTADELVRLKQVVGIAKLFAIPEYTRAWGEDDKI
jgi:ParB-like chromosome segregation protein Spo0J